MRDVSDGMHTDNNAGGPSGPLAPNSHSAEAESCRDERPPAMLTLGIFLLRQRARTAMVSINKESHKPLPEYSGTPITDDL